MHLNDKRWKLFDLYLHKILTDKKGPQIILNSHYSIIHCYFAVHINAQKKDLFFFGTALPVHNWILDLLDYL